MPKSTHDVFLAIDSDDELYGVCKYYEKPMDAPVNTPKYKRFCSVCKRQTYDWVCCGQRTRNANFGQTIKDVVLFQSREEDKP